MPVIRLKTEGARLAEITSEDLQYKREVIGKRHLSIWEQIHRELHHNGRRSPFCPRCNLSMAEMVDKKVTIPYAFLLEYEYVFMRRVFGARIVEWRDHHREHASRGLVFSICPLCPLEVK